MATDKKSGDPLGKLLGNYSSFARGIGWLVGAAIITGIGLLVFLNAVSISNALYDGEGLKHVYHGLGILLFAFAAFMVVVGLGFLRMSLEFRKKGLRLRKFFGTKEMTWAEIKKIHVDKLTIVEASGSGRRSKYKITITSVDDEMYLGPSFLNVVSPITVIQMLKMHSERDVTGDADDIRVPRSKKADREDAAPAATKDSDLFQDACAMLERGEDALAVERWLKGKGLPSKVARAMVDKAAAGAALAKYDGDAKEEDRYHKEIKKRLKAGVHPDKIRRWLRDEENVGPAMIDAMIADAREDLL